MSAHTEPEKNSTGEEHQESARDERDLVDELEGSAGEVGVPVDAICTSCRLIRAKRAPRDCVDDDGRGGSSFKHVCHRCQRGTWWNVRRALVDVDEWGQS